MFLFCMYIYISVIHAKVVYMHMYIYKKEKNIYLCVWVYEMPCLAKYHSLSRSTSAIHDMELWKVRCARVTMHARFVSSSVSRILVVCMYEEEDTCQVI
jgi:hypothetical protein